MQPAADELGLAVRSVDRLREEPELVAQRRVVGTHGRLEVLGEHLELEPAIAADEAEAASLPFGRGDGGRPVDLDAERSRRHGEALAARDERDGHALEPRRPLLEQPLRVGRSEAADVDAGDPGAARELLRRAGEDEAERDSDEQDDTAEGQQAGPEASARRGTAAGLKSRRGGSHCPGHGSAGPVGR